jgi:hypothetical protein
MERGGEPGWLVVPIPLYIIVSVVCRLVGLCVPEGILHYMQL